MADEVSQIRFETVGLETIQGQFDKVRASVKEFTNEQTTGVPKVQKLYREAANAVQLLADKYGIASVQARDAAKAAAEIAEKISVNRKVIESFEPGKKFQIMSGALKGVAAGYELVTAAQGLFGDGSEEVTKKIAQLQEAMAITHALGEIGKAREEFKALGAVIQSSSIAQSAKNVVDKIAIGISGLLGASTKVQAEATEELAIGTEAATVATDGAAASMNALKIAIAATGIGLLVIGIAALVVYWDDLKDAIMGTSDETRKAAEVEKDLDNIRQEGNKSASEEIVKVRILTQAATDNNLTQAERLKAANKLKDLYPVTFKNYSAEKIALGEAKKATDDLTNSILQQAMAKAAMSKLTELETQRLDIETENTKEINKIYSAEFEKNVRLQRAMMDETTTADDLAQARADALLKINGRSLDKLKDIKETEDAIIKSIGKVDIEKGVVDEGEKEKKPKKDNAQKKENTKRKKQLKDELDDIKESSKDKIKVIDKELLYYKKHSKELISLEVLTQSEINRIVKKLGEEKLKEIQDRNNKEVIAQDEIQALQAKTEKEKFDASVARLIDDRDIKLQNEQLTASERLQIEAQFQADYKKLKGDFDENQIKAANELKDRKIALAIQEDEMKKSILEKENVYTKDHWKNLRAIIDDEWQQKILSIGSKYDEEVRLAGDNKDKIVQIEKEKLAAIKEANQEHTDTIIDLNKKQGDSHMELLQAIGDAMGQLSGIIGKQTAAGKAFAIAEATINTFKAALQVFSGPMPGPPPVALALKIVSMVAAIATGFKTIKSIVSVKVPGTGAGGAASMPSMPSVQNPTTMFQSAQLFGIGGQQIKDVRALRDQKIYVTEQDISRQQARVSQVRRASVQGG